MKKSCKFSARFLQISSNEFWELRSGGAVRLGAISATWRGRPTLGARTNPAGLGGDRAIVVRRIVAPLALIDVERAAIEVNRPGDDAMAIPGIGDDHLAAWQRDQHQAVRAPCSSARGVVDPQFGSCKEPLEGDRRQVAAIAELLGILLAILKDIRVREENVVDENEMLTHRFDFLFT